MAAAELSPLQKPTMRGWLHAGMTPVVLLAGILLVVLAPAGAGRLGAAVWLAGSLVLFGTSAVYHRGRWTPTVQSWLQRADHSNIFGFIAATYTPLALALLEGAQRTLLLSLVWGIAAAGVGLTLLWPGRP
ncbi:MAG: hemolysin III family protein, partial [Propionibacteriaceae bacterium]|nr:hemolysin III family protein [Propionibacteriaceae bacterium]